LSIALFRLYLHRPDWMDLSQDVVRSELCAAAAFDPSGLWPSSLDDELDNMLDGLVGGDFQMTKSLSEVARAHPLLLLRLLPQMTKILLQDAAEPISLAGNENRSVVKGVSWYEPIETSLSGRQIHLSVRHWGYRYTEPLWASVLEIVLCAPAQVLFGCGLQLGLGKLLGTYLQLVSVQGLLRTAERSSSLKSRLGECFSLFQSESSLQWTTWLSSRVEGAEVRHMLISCGFMTATEAIESLKGGET
jgi:hypothetical protein